MTTAPLDNAASPDRTLAVDQTARLRRIRDRIASAISAVFASFDGLLAKRAVWIATVLLILGLQIALTALHRPWLDEWQSVQIAVESPRIADLLFNLRYEGHPPLWYLVLRVVAGWFADPARALSLVALVLAVPVQLTILLGAPFTRAERVMISLSEFVLFEYLTVSRSLTMGFAVMICIAAWWKRDRVAGLLIALLPQCDFLFGVISVLLVLLRWRERRIDKPSLLLWLASGALAAWSVRTMPDMVPALLPKGLGKDFSVWLADFSTLGLPLQWQGRQLLWNSPPPPGLGGPALVCFVTMAWIELRKKRDFLLAFIAFVGLTLVFSLTVYQLSIRHLSLAATLLILLVWRLAENGEERSVWWRAWLLVLSLCGLLTAVVNFMEPFHTAQETAALINRLGLREKTWVPFPHSAGQSVAAVNTMMFERLTEHCSEDMIRWNEADGHHVTDMVALRLRLRRKVAEDGRFYLLTWIPLQNEPPLLLQLGIVAQGYDGLPFYLYVVGEDHADARPHGVTCITPLGPLRRR